MQFRWDFWDFWDFFKEYILRIVIIWLALLSAFSIVVYLLIKFWLGKDIAIEYWIISVVAGLIIAQSIVYYRTARRQIPGERIESWPAPVIGGHIRYSQYHKDCIVNVTPNCCHSD